MTTARQEKPSVPTPDAAEVYAHHLSQMSRPMRVAVERYVAELVAECKRLADKDTAKLDEGLALCRATLDEMKIEAELRPFRDELADAGHDDEPNRDPTKQRMRDEQDALLAGYARRPLVNALADEMERKLRKHDNSRGKLGWQDDQPPDLLVRLREEANELEIAVRQYIGSAESEASRAEVLSEAADVANFAMMVADQCGAMAQAAARTPSPAAGAAALADWEPTLCGGGYRHVQTGWSAFPCDGRWDIDCGKGVCISAGGHYRTLAEAAAEVERLAAASTAPAVVRGDGLGVDYSEIMEAAMSAMNDGGLVADGIVEGIRNYDQQRTRLAQLEAAAGKKAGA